MRIKKENQLRKINMKALWAKCILQKLSLGKTADFYSKNKSPALIEQSKFDKKLGLSVVKKSSKFDVL